MVEVGLGTARYCVLIVLGALAVGCGGAAVPQAQMTSAETEVRAAEVAGAPEVPKGKLHLKYARDQIEEAKALIEEGKNEEAERVLQRAEIDARYAHSLAEQEEAQQEAQEVLDRIEELTQGVGK
jgi:uncharacterized protein HemX